MKRATTTRLPPEVGWHYLRAAGDEYDAVQRARIRAGNRQDAFQRNAGDALDERHKSMAEMLGVDIAGQLQGLEDDVARALRRVYRKVVPDVIVQWQQAQLGVGDLQFARLLGHLGHPRIAEPSHWEGTGSDRILVAEEPFERTVSQLVAYCGRTGDPMRRKRVGMSAEEAFGGGKPVLKMLTFLIAEAMVKAGVRKLGEPNDSVRYDIEARKAISPWGQMYLDLRREHFERLDWTPGHQHSAALHRIAKELVKELWRVAGEDPALPELRAQIAETGVSVLSTSPNARSTPPSQHKLVAGPGHRSGDTHHEPAGAGHPSTAAAASRDASTPISTATPPPQPRRLVRKRTS